VNSLVSKLQVTARNGPRNPSALKGAPRDSFFKLRFPPSEKIQSNQASLRIGASRNPVLRPGGHGWLAIVAGFVDHDFMIRYQLLVLSSAVIVHAATCLAQSYTWAQRMGGDAPGLYGDGEVIDFTWSWQLAGEPITGTASITRIGSGRHYFGSEVLRDTILAVPGFIAPEFDNSPFAVSVGGVSGIYSFMSGGELGRAVDDAPGGQLSVTTMRFSFQKGRSAPPNTLIQLFDPGAFEAGVSGPFTYQFKASLSGVPVDTASWTVQIVDPYTPASNATTGITWDGDTVTVPSFLNGAGSGQNYPDTIVFINTQLTSFDNLTVRAEGLNLDEFTIGFGANARAFIVPYIQISPQLDGRLRIEFTGRLESKVDLESGSWEVVAGATGSPYDFTPSDPKRLFRSVVSR
jgi:hypothetical protein